MRLHPFTLSQAFPNAGKGCHYCTYLSLTHHHSRWQDLQAQLLSAGLAGAVALQVMGIALDLVNLRSETYAEDSRIPEQTFGTPLQVCPCRRPPPPLFHTLLPFLVPF